MYSGIIPLGIGVAVGQIKNGKERKMTYIEKREIIEKILAHAYSSKVAVLELIGAISIDPNAFWAITVEDEYYEEHRMMKELDVIDEILTKRFDYKMEDFQELVKDAYVSNHSE